MRRLASTIIAASLLACPAADLTLGWTAAGQLLVTLDTDVTARSDRFLIYAQNSTTNSNCAGLPEGSGGNLRDDSSTFGSISSSNLWNWCVTFKKAF